jgi:thioredoxin reductase
METYDVIIVGGGHNALVCAAYLTPMTRELHARCGHRPGSGVRGSSGYIVAQKLL